MHFFMELGRFWVNLVGISHKKSGCPAFLDSGRCAHRPRCNRHLAAAWSKPQPSQNFLLLVSYSVTLDSLLNSLVVRPGM